MIKIGNLYKSKVPMCLWYTLPDGKTKYDYFQGAFIALLFKSGETSWKNTRYHFLVGKKIYFGGFDSRKSFFHYFEEIS